MIYQFHFLALPQELQDMNAKTSVHIYVHCSTVYDNQDLKLTKCLTLNKIRKGDSSIGIRKIVQGTAWSPDDLPWVTHPRNCEINIYIQWNAMSFYLLRPLDGTR